jgi:hypothetical protein
LSQMDRALRDSVAEICGIRDLNTS